MSSLTYCDTDSRPLPYTSSTFDRSAPQPDYTIGLATHLLTAADYVKHLFNLRTEMSRQANLEDSNRERTNNRRDNEHGSSSHFSGLNLDQITDYIGAEFLPLYGQCGPLVFYAILIIVAWFVFCYLIEGIITMGLAFKMVGCSPWVFYGFVGKVMWLPLLPFISAVRDRDIKNRLQDLLGLSSRPGVPGSPPPCYTTTITVENPEIERGSWKYQPGPEHSQIRNDHPTASHPDGAEGPIPVPRAQAEAVLEDALLTNNEVSRTVNQTMWRQTIANKAMLQAILGHLRIPYRPEIPIQIRDPGGETDTGYETQP